MTTLFALFVGAFLAATILPFSSEAMLIAALNAEQFDKWQLVSVAATGNTLGAVVNWGIGRYLLHWAARSWFPISPQQLAHASERFNKYGVWSLLLAWVPFIGDPLTFAAGILNVRFMIFLPLVAIGKTTRYMVVSWPF